MAQVDPDKFFEEYEHRRKFTPPLHTPSLIIPINRDSFGRVNASQDEIAAVLRIRDESLHISNRELRRLERAARSKGGGPERRG